MTGKKKITGSLEVSGNIVSIEEPLVVKTKKILWADLVTLRDAGELIPGQQYRITDYECTTVQENTQSAGHQFDIIVTADDVNKLNEQARAIQHAGDTYFANSKLEAWQVWYSLDNDTTRFAWADEENGKGVIYRMIDEWNNDVPYDFKNIQFKREGFYDDDYNIYFDNIYFYTFSAYSFASATGIQSDIEDATIITKQEGIDEFFNNCHSNVIKPLFTALYFGTVDVPAWELSNNLFINRYASDDMYFSCHHNTFGNSCGSNTFGNDCNSNTFGNNCYSNTFGGSCRDNTFANDCNSNTFGNNCYSNTFGNSCGSNTFGNDCNSNTFGNSCSYLLISDTSWASKRYISVDSGVQGASSANKFDLYDSAILDKNYQVTFKKSASGKHLMLWATDTGTMTGKVKDSVLDNTWEDIV